MQVTIIQKSKDLAALAALYLYAAAHKATPLTPLLPLELKPARDIVPAPVLLRFLFFKSILRFNSVWPLSSLDYRQG